MPSIARPQKVYDFTAHARRQPTAPPPGDRIDAQLQNHANAIAATQLAVEQLEARQTQPLDVEAPARAIIVQAERAAQEIRRTAGDAAAIVDQAKFELSRIWAETARARDAADRAEARIAAAVLEAQPRVDNANRPDLAYSPGQAMPKLGYGAGGYYASDDAGAAAVSADYAQVAIEWAEHLPDTIPPNILAINAISGEHWSSRWWANRAANAFGMLAWWYQGAWPSPGPPTTPNTPTGQPIPPGAMYWDTTTNTMMVWNGSTWVSASRPAPAVTSTLFYLATAGQTVFPLSTPDRAGQSFAFTAQAPEGVAAYINGVRVEPVYDYAIDIPSSTITFARALTLNALVIFDLLSPKAQLAPAGSATTLLLSPITPDGVKVAFTGLTIAASGQPVSVSKNEELLVSVDGIQQQPGSAYTASGSSITFAQAPDANANIYIVWFGPAGTGGGGALIGGPVDLVAQTVVQSGATLAINRALGENVVVSLTANITSISVTGWPAAGYTGKVRLIVNNTGAFTMSGWPAGVTWPGAAPPVITSGVGKRDVILLMSDNAGAAITGSIVGQDYR